MSRRATVCSVALTDRHAVERQARTGRLCGNCENVNKVAAEKVVFLNIKSKYLMTQAVILTYFCSTTTEAGKTKLAADGVLTFEPLTHAIQWGAWSSRRYLTISSSWP